MRDKNLLGGSPSPAANWDSKKRMVEPSMVGTSTSGIKKTKLPGSHPRSWYARRSSSVTVVFLKKSVSYGIPPSAILVAPRVGEKRLPSRCFSPWSRAQSRRWPMGQHEQRGLGQWCQSWSSKRWRQWKMRRQEREMTKHDEYNGAQLYMGDRWQGGDLSP
jgi:hypothetical protein